jgi:hypothetical protein
MQWDSKRMKSIGHVARMREMKEGHKSLFRKTEGERNHSEDLA